MKQTGSGLLSIPGRGELWQLARRRLPFRKMTPVK